MNTMSVVTPLAGQVAVVTGAARGIGLGIARRLAASGADLVLSDLDVDALLGVEHALMQEFPVSVISCPGDLSREDVVAQLQTQSRERFGKVQILINCAGGGVIRPFLDHTAETLKATVDRNLWTVLWCTRAFLPEMLEAGYGRVINLGADSVRNGLWDHAAYNAAKGGVHALTSGLAREFATSGVTFNTVAPCAVATPQLIHFIETQPDLAQRFIDVIPMGRAAEIDEVVSMVHYLALPESSFVTGQVISVNGGSSMQ